MKIRMNESYDDYNYDDEYSLDNSNLYKDFINNNTIGYYSKEPKKSKSVKAGNTEDTITDRKIDARNGFTDDLEENKILKLAILYDYYCYDIEEDAPDGKIRVDDARTKYGNPDDPSDEKYLRCVRITKRDKLIA